MKGLADTTELFEITTSKLMDEETANPQAGVALIDQWIALLSESENTQPMAGELHKLKALLADPAAATETVAQMELIAKKVTEISTDIGAEGEMPSLLTGLAAALRMGGDSQKA